MSRVIRISETSKQRLEKYFPGEKTWDAKVSSLLDAVPPAQKEKLECGSTADNQIKK